jgi:hypothetical protein
VADDIADPAGPKGSSPVGRGGAGFYIEGELGAFYLLAMLAGAEARGMPGAVLNRVRFQGADAGYALDDLVLHGTGSTGATMLEIQSKRTIKFSPKDPLFEDVCGQIARTAPRDAVADERHLLAVATQRTSHRISGPYQDVLQWASAAEDGTAFFARLASDGASADMRQFTATFRSNLVAHAVADDEDVLWRLLRRFRIMEFDFESSAPLARTHALLLARLSLEAADAPRAEALWANLIEISLATARMGGSLDRATLRATLAGRGFLLAGQRDFAPARTRIEEMARFALADVGTTLAGFQLPRLGLQRRIDGARDGHRFVQIGGGPGVGKSAAFLHTARRAMRDSRVIVLDPIGTPDGGWMSLAHLLGVPGTAAEFLSDLAASGGAVLFIDSLEMFTSLAKRRTVNDLLRAVSGIEGFSVVATARSDFGADGDLWLAADAMAAFGPVGEVNVGELGEDEVTMLRERVPELRALLAPGHPAAAIARNPYRLSRMLGIPAGAAIRSEAWLAKHWWDTGDGVENGHLRASQRLLSDLADAALAGLDAVELREDTPARAHLLRTLSLRERRDMVAFYHDVLRDWAVGMRLQENAMLPASIDLSNPVTAGVARGVEFAGRLALETDGSGTRWTTLLGALSIPGAHGSWRRQALLALLRSELSFELLEQHTALLLRRGAAILTELVNAVVAVETVPTAQLFEGAPLKGGGTMPEAPSSMRTAITPAGRRLLRWCVAHAVELPIQGVDAVIKLVAVQTPLALIAPALAQEAARVLFGWLLQLDLREATVSIPVDATVDRPDSSVRIRMIGDLRNTALMHAASAPEEAGAYLDAVAEERDTFKVKEIRTFSGILAPVVPEQLANLIGGSLIEPEGRDGRRGGRERDRTLSFADTDYLSPSPAQPPFLSLLNAAPQVGLALIRRLTSHAIAFKSGGRDPGGDGYALQFDEGPRFFPWVQSYFWSRGQGDAYAVSSALMALEAWSHGRLDAGEDVDRVLADILGQDGSCAAYLMVAIDVLLSHWPATRRALVPFVSSPCLLSADRQREVLEQMGDDWGGWKAEPPGRVKLEDLRSRPSRGVQLERLLVGYLSPDGPSSDVRARLAHAVDALGPYSDADDFGDPAFMGAYALNTLDPANWHDVEGGKAYRSPPIEAAHLARLGAKRDEIFTTSNMDARIQLAVSDCAHGSAQAARDASDIAGAELPYPSDDDASSRSTRLVATALLIARDGDDALLDARAGWIRDVAGIALANGSGRHSGGGGLLAHDRAAMAASALVHLWHRRHSKDDRKDILALALRGDRTGPRALQAAMSELTERDPRLLKSIVRAAFAACTWRWHPYEEDVEETARQKSVKAAADGRALAAEIDWLDGGVEAPWPAFPDDEPPLRRWNRKFPTGRTGPDREAVATSYAAAESHATLRPDTQRAAAWLALAGASPAAVKWIPEIISAYAGWTAKINGSGLDVDAEVERAPTEWNAQFFALAAPVLMTGSEATFEKIVGLIEGLPDKPFGDAAEAILQAADVWYFNDATRLPARPVLLRARLAARVTRLSRWLWNHRPGDLSIDLETGGVVAKLFLNTYTPFGAGTRSYLVPAVVDRLDPLLDVLQPIMSGGPTTLIALCTMNTLGVAPRARHADFLITAAESWLDRLQSDPTIWIELGIGRRLVEWLLGAEVEEPGLLTRSHPLIPRINAVLGRLIAMGVAEAHDLEQWMGAPAGQAPAIRRD